MPFQKKVVTDESQSEVNAPKSDSVLMKYVGHFKGLQKIVELPIPLISKSQKLEEVLRFERSNERQGPAFCDVPMEWVGQLMDVGGNWKLVEPASDELMVKIRAAQKVCQDKMQKFALENELVEA